MEILAIDTCFNRCAVLHYDAAKGEALALSLQAMERGHAELLPLIIKSFTMPHLSRIVVTTGPGTFTGVRIGLSFARAYGLARGLPVLGLDTLRALRLTHPNATIAHKAGKSGYAYVLRDNAIELVEAGAVPHDALGTMRSEHDLPDMVALARWAAEQPIPTAMPEPVYIREADAKPQVMIRAAQARDVSALAALHAASFPQGWSAQDLSAMLKVTGTTAALAEAGGEVMGFILTRTIADEAEILTICVAPNRRRLGIARRLLDQALRSSAKFFLEAAADNAAARALYDAAGFRETGRRKAYYTSGQDAVLMARERP